MFNIKNNEKTGFACLLMVLFLVLFFFCIVDSAFCSVERSKNKKNTRIKITKDDLRWFGKTIFQKECGSDIKRLTAWNKGEEFPSFGIGHFIWYPVGYEGPFEESFPSFLAFVKKRGVQLPLWIDNLKIKDCPWKTRDEFYRKMDSYKMNSLKAFLVETMHYQSLYIVKRFKKSLPMMIRAASPEKKKHIKRQFFRVADSSKKLYALIDYVNFKGEGVKATERYNNKGWGLLQVLEEMQGTRRGDIALHEFSRAAEAVLTRRVQNAPHDRNEGQWLNGWKNRVNYYRTLSRYL